MAIEQNLVCFNTFDSDESWTLATYEKHDGYVAWRKILSGGMTPDEVIEEVKASGLRGRGRRRLSHRAQVELHAEKLRRAEVSRRPIPTNPSRAPAMIARSCAVTRTASSRAWPSRPTRWGRLSPITICAANSWTSRSPRFEAAVREAYDAGLLGKDVQGSGIDIDIHGFIGAGAYICGGGDRSARVARGQAGPSPIQAAVPGKLRPCTASRRPSTIPRVSPASPSIIRRGAAWFAGLGPEGVRWHGPVLGVGSRRTARQLRTAHGNSVQDPARGLLRRRLERPASSRRSFPAARPARYCRPT